jgi:hypothetical protein
MEGELPSIFLFDMFLQQPKSSYVMAEFPGPGTTQIG